MDTGPVHPAAEALKVVLEAMPGAAGDPRGPPRAREPYSIIFKVMGKMFAILGVRGPSAPFVILKSDPHLAEILREQYAGVGHRSHLDRRFWIAVDLDADVPADEVERLVGQSYALVCEGLTRKQQAELAQR
jgi:predicted DNA-binding protein (MmcQ/YjbR family)